MAETKLFDKDQAQISVVIRDVTVPGMVTDADLLCFYGLLFLEPEERRSLERKGTGSLMSVVQDRQRAMIAELEAKALQDIIQKQPALDRLATEKLAKEQAAKEYDQNLTEAIFFKLNSHSTRAEMAARVIEVFPSIDPSWVNYDAQRGIGSFRLTAQESMKLIMSILGGLMGLSYEQPSEKQVDQLTIPIPENGNGKDATPIAATPVPATETLSTDPPSEINGTGNRFGLSEEVIASLPAEARQRLGV